MDQAASSLPALVVAGTHSGVGKTSVALGLIGALRRRGLVVQPFKIGPDFIDPLHHAAASARPPRNLDGWMLSPEANRERFARAAGDADAVVLEAMMGLFDGRDGASERGSSAEMAKWLGVPVVLVVDASAIARSAAALIHGYATFDPDLRLAGVILNRVGGAAHAQMIRDAVTGAVPILGAIPHDSGLVVPERHLGLHLPHEADRDHASRLADLVQARVDLPGLLAAAAIPRPPGAPDRSRRTRDRPRVRVGVARDEAFCFYYEDNLELLRDAGAELVEFSPLRDPLPAGLHGLYLGGGYPELHADALTANARAREAIRELARSGAPVYGECGGLMYLGETLHVDGVAYPMCGALALSTRIPAGLSLGYVEVSTLGGPFGEGATARGHVFHHSALDGEPSLAAGYTLSTGDGPVTPAGFRAGNVLAGYAHLSFAETDLPARFVAAAARHREPEVSTSPC